MMKSSHRGLLSVVLLVFWCAEAEAGIRFLNGSAGLSDAVKKTAKPTINTMVDVDADKTVVCQSVRWGFYEVRKCR